MSGFVDDFVYYDLEEVCFCKMIGGCWEVMVYFGIVSVLLVFFL